MHRIVSATVHPALRLILLALALCLSVTANAEEPDVRTTWRLLDYIAVDYASAVSEGRVADEFEYREMVEFSDVVARQIAALPDTKDNQALIRRSDQLRALIANKEPAERVGRLARALAASLLTAYPVPLAPSQAPDLDRARTLFAQNCASCHGAAGSAPPAAMQALDPPPIDFTDIDRARQRSAFGLYQVITQGLEGTSMASFASLSDEDRWALAFHAGSIAFEDVAKGERIWREDDGIRQLVPDLETLAALTPESLAEQIGEDRALAVMAYLRANPDAVGQANDAGSLAFVRDTLDRSLSAYRAGNREEARQLALSAYLDGFEPLEALLATRDGGLMREVEQALGQFRTGIESGANPFELQQLRARIDSLLARAEEALAPEAASEISTFLGAFTILLREGIEAILVVIAMIAFVKKSQRSEVLPYKRGGLSCRSRDPARRAGYHLHRTGSADRGDPLPRRARRSGQQVRHRPVVRPGDAYENDTSIAKRAGVFRRTGSSVRRAARVGAVRHPRWREVRNHASGRSHPRQACCRYESEPVRRGAFRGSDRDRMRRYRSSVTACRARILSRPVSGTGERHARPVRSFRPVAEVWQEDCLLLADRATPCFACRNPPAAAPRNPSPRGRRFS